MSSRNAFRRAVSTTIETSSSTVGRFSISSIFAEFRMRSMCSRTNRPYSWPCSSFQ